MLGFFISSALAILNIIAIPTFANSDLCPSKLNGNRMNETHLSKLSQASTTGDLENVLIDDLDWIVKLIANGNLIVVTNPGNPKQIVIFQTTSLGSYFSDVSKSEAERLVQSLRDQKTFVLKDVEPAYEDANSLSESDIVAIKNNVMSIPHLLKRKGWTSEVLLDLIDEHSKTKMPNAARSVIKAAYNSLRAVTRATSAC